MPQKKFGLDQIESGKVGYTALEDRLTGIDNSLGSEGAEIARVNETVMSIASAPITTPIFTEVLTYTVLSTDIEEDTATVITLPNSKTYSVGKGHMLVLRNGQFQNLGGDYSEASSTTVQFSANVLREGDVLTFIVGTPTKLAYAVAVSYYNSGTSEGMIQTLTYTGDIARTVTYTYNSDGKIATEVIVEGGVTTTKTYTYDSTTKKITGVAAVIS